MSKKRPGPVRPQYSSLSLVQVDPSVLSKVQFDQEVGNLVDGRIKLTKPRGNKYVLEVKAPVTHAGRLTLNNGFYQPRQMAVGADSFLRPYPKPVILAHNSSGDPIGRTVNCEYVDTPQAGLFTGQASHLSREDTFSLIQSMMKSGIVYDRSFEGLGFVRTTMHITEKDAIEKFLDERYMTFSIRTTTDEVVCPHDGKPFKSIWDYIMGGEEEEEGKDSEHCEHGPFAEVDGMPGFLVFEKMSFPETSVVTIPADELAMVESMEEFTMLDSQESIKQIPVVDACYTLRSDQLPEGGNGKDMAVNQDKNGSSTETPKPDFDWKQLSDSSSASDIYRGVSELLDEDQQLEPEKLEGLGGTYFCGPGRSFPVTDAEHVSATRQLLEGANFSDSFKERVGKMVDKKAKAIGCDRAPAEVLCDFVSGELQQVSDFDVVSVYEAIAQDMVSRGFNISEIDGFEKVVSDSDSQEVAGLKSQLQEVTVARDGLTKQITDLTVETKESAATTNALLAVVSDNLNVESLEQAKDAALELELSELQAKNKELLASDKVQEGIERFLEGRAVVTDSGEVTDDTLQSEVAKPGNEELDPITASVLERFQNLKTNSVAKAHQYIDQMELQGYIGSDLVTELKKEDSTEEEEG